MNEESIFYIDKTGYKIIPYAVNKKPGHFKLLLKRSDHKEFNIGEVFECKNGFVGWNYVKYEKEANIHRASDSWSINYDVLKTLFQGHVIIHTEIGRYNVAAMYAMTQGIFLHFKKAQIEKKIYLKKSLFTFKPK